MSESDNTCRVCRGEGSKNNPLYHPCKCRGSIKYIHQDCLMEWLKHANKSEEKCGICNAPYKFRTIFDPSMPKYIPKRFVWAKSKQLLRSVVVKSLSIALYFLCLLVEVPLFWISIGRVYTWTINGKLPNNNPNFIDALLFGNLDISEHHSKSTFFKMFSRIGDIFTYTYLSGVCYIIIFAIVHLALFIEHEWVIRDEGYLKLLQKKIGKEPRTKLIDILRQELRGLRNDGAAGDDDAAASIQRLEMIARAINDLQEQPNQGDNEERLRRAMEQDDALVVRNNQEFRVNDHVPQASNNADNSPSNEIDTDVNGEDAPTLDSGDIVESGSSLARYESQNEDNDVPNADDEDIRNEEVDTDLEDNIDEFGMNDVENNVDQDQEAVGGAQDFLEMSGISLDLTTPIFLMSICDLIIIVYLFFAYLVPHLIGTSFVLIMGYLLRFLYSVFSPSNTFGSEVLSWCGGLNTMRSSNNLVISFSSYLFIDSFIKPILKSFHKIFILGELDHPTLEERIFLISLGYAIICYGIYMLMKSLVSGKKPIMGNQRKIYKILFEIASTAKVFVIFAIEIFFFPVYCGWLLDFCIAPLVLSKLTEVSRDESIVFKVLFTSASNVFEFTIVRTLLHWFLGTHYMLFFAHYIGMIRSKILRPGVLFFIRSPDDPNARLIHDALSKPLVLQLSRIYLSAKVYSAFILIGFGGVTWGIKYLISLDRKDSSNVLLPFQEPLLGSCFIAMACVVDLASNKSIITRYCRRYWKIAFEVSSHKLRLSHFILGKPIAEERGTLVYRNLFVQYLGKQPPDYSKPVALAETSSIFKEDSTIEVCFVPDGNYVRAPDNDTVSRAFIKKLFVPVTKDDNLIEAPANDTASVFSDSDTDSLSDVANEDAYTVVYRPPNFRLRCLGLILLLWLFAIILILSVILLALMVGRPVFKVFYISLNYLNIDSRSYFMHRLQDVHWELADIASIAFGLKLLLELLKIYDKNSDEVRNEVGIDANAAGEGERNQFAILGLANFFRREMGNYYLVSLIVPLESFLRTKWVYALHKNAVNLPFQVFLNKTLVNENKDISFEVLFVHFIVSVWTVLPTYIFFIRSRVFGLLANQNPVDAIRRSDIPQLIQDCLITNVAFYLFKKYHVSSNWDAKDDAKTWMVILACFITIKTLFGLRSFIIMISEQVRNEKYVKGRAVENVD